MKFYKITNNQLVSGSGSKIPDDTWSTDWNILDTKEDGSYYKYYKEDYSVDTVKEAEALATITKQELSAHKEREIVTNVLDRDDQLNMLALIIEQVGTHAGLDTEEFTLAKEKFAEIQTILAKEVI